MDVCIVDLGCKKPRTKNGALIILEKPILNPYSCVLSEFRDEGGRPGTDFGAGSRSVRCRGQNETRAQWSHHGREGEPQ